MKGNIKMEIPTSTREAAKALLRPYVNGGTLQRIVKSQPGVNYSAFSARVGGGCITDYHGRDHVIERHQVVVTRLGDRHCFAVFSLSEIIAEIRDEKRGYIQPMLWRGD